MAYFLDMLLLICREMALTISGIRNINDVARNICNQTLKFKWHVRNTFPPNSTIITCPANIIASTMSRPRH